MHFGRSCLSGAEVRWENLGERMMKVDQQNGHLAILIGEQLSSVIFVQDYLQLDFDGRRLTLNEWPKLFTLEGEFHFGEKGYRDELCSFIARKVERVDESENLIRMVFTDGSSIRVDLSESRVGEGDRVIFNDGLNRSWSWW